MIQELLQAKVSALATNGDSFSFLHAETDWQNLQADEIVLPAVFLDMPIAFTPEITMTGHFKRRYICVALFLYPSNLDDTPEQRYEAFKKAENVQRDFQLMINNDIDNFEGLNVGRCYQIVNFMDRNMDGVVMPFDVIERNHDGVCVPATTSSNVTLKLNDAEWIEILCGTLQNITLQDADGFELTPFSIEGSTITIGNSIVTNSAGTVLATILSQENAELADVDNMDSDGSTVPTPAGVPFVCTPVAPCADGTVNVNKSDGALISAVTVASGGTQPYNVADSTAVIKNTAGTTLLTENIKATESEDIEAPDAIVNVNGTLWSEVPSGTTENIQVLQSSGAVEVGAKVGDNFRIGDNDVTLNGDPFLTLKAEENEDIELVDQNENPITPDSVVGTKITVSTGGTVQGLTLMKTGQTTQRVPFDDGAQEMGRLTDHVTLNYNNPFGNTKRFTDKTDAGTFANSVAYDWSTWNESDGKVLAYYFGDSAFRNLTDHCAQHVASTIDGLANDWYLTNFTQLINIVNGELIANFMLNYAPFNLGGRYYWLSSSGSGNGTATDLAADGWLIAVSKTNTYQAIFVRECTVVGTTIT